MRKNILRLATLLTLYLVLLQSPAFVGGGVSAGGPPSNRPHGDACASILFHKDLSLSLFTLPLSGTTFVVTTAADNLDNNNPTPGSLRAAIREANLNPGADTIVFSVPGAGPHQISVGAGLPVITDTVVIDGYSQPGASENTLATGNDAVLKIEIRDQTLSQGTAITIGASDCVVQGLVIHGFNTAIWIDGSRTNAGASRNVVRGNFIGTNTAGTAVSADYSFSAAGNLRGGVTIDGGGFKPDGTPGTANNNTIGGASPAARNVISGNGSFGVHIGKNIGAATATGNLIQGNYIGTNAAGAAALGNGAGLFITTNGNTIGGTAAGARNVISGNNYNSLTSVGVNLCCGADDNLIQGNYIGTNATGTQALPNAVHGILINNNAHNNTVGGTTPEARNVISGNAVVGVAIGNSSSGNKVQGNYIGTDATGAEALGNGFNGVHVSQATSATIGGALPGEGNLISANLSGGVEIVSDNTIVQGNFIGTKADGTSPLGNPQYGVRVGGVGVLVGGRASGAGNRIAFSKSGSVDFGSGVIVTHGTGVAVVGNSIHSNDGLGIDLGRNWLTANDACDPDSEGSSNGLQNYPVLSSAASGGNTSIEGTLNSKPGVTYTLDFYSNDSCDATGFGEGRTYLGSATVTTDPICSASFNVSLPVAVPAGQVVTATATDSSGNTSEFSACVPVTLLNSPPDAVDDAAATDEDTPVTVSVLANDTDPDGDTLSVGSFTQGINGSVASNGDGTLRYTPAANFNGADSFSYSVSDGNGGTDSATANITVNAVADPPDAVNDTASTNEDAAININVLANDAAGDCGDALSILSFTQGAHGSVAVNPDRTMRYTPNANFNGADSFRYTIGCAGGGASASLLKQGPAAKLAEALRPGATLAKLFQSVAAAAEESDEAEVSVSVTPVNDPPDAVDDAATTQQDTAVTLNVLANDTDVENDAFIVSAFTQGANGSVTANADGTLTYTPNSGYSGADSFTYTITDGNGGTDTATVSVTVNRVSAPPDAVDDAATTDEDRNVTINARANDSDGNCGAVSVSAFTQGANGTVILVSPNGTFGYFPAAHFHGTDTFTYTLRCAAGDTDTATVTVTVNPVNDVPDARDDSYATDEDTPLNIAAPGVLSNDTDNDGDALTAALVSGPPFRTVTLNPDGSFAYTPPPNYNGPVTFTYEVSDGHGGTDRAVVTINVAPFNDPPIASDDTVTTREDRSISFNVLTNDTDLEGENLTVLGVTQPANGRASFVPSGSGGVSYAPNRDFNGLDAFTYTMRDAGGNTATATVFVTVTPANDAPSATDDSYVTDGAPLTVSAPGVLANDRDIDGDPLTAVRVSNPLQGALSFNPDGSFTYTPSANATGCDSFEYMNTDGSANSNFATVTILFQPAAAPSARSAFAPEPGGSFVSAAGKESKVKGSDAADSLSAFAGKGAAPSPHAARDNSTPAPSWVRTANLNSARVFHTATLLRDGKVLVVGGTSNAVKDFFTGKTFLKTTELYDPATGTWRRTGDLGTARAHHTAMLLADGKVLVAGGVGERGVVLATAEVYDPTTGVWTRTRDNMSVARAAHTATFLPVAPPTPTVPPPPGAPLLPSGKALVVGGVGSNLSALNSAEVYDPATDTWTRTRSLTTRRWAHTATLLDGNRVLVAGGYDGSLVQHTAEVYDAAADTWTRTSGNMSAARGHHAATRLRDGRVLLSGGMGPRGILDSAEVYNPATGAFTATQGRLSIGRWLHTATLLRDGNVLVAGGNTDNNFGRSATNTAEVYDSAADTWTRTANLVAGRHSQTAMLLHDNRVLVAGGMHAAATLNKAELYDPLDARPLFSTCAGVTVTAVHGEGFHGNSRIARIENGRVPCMHAETGETAECQFSTSGVSAGLMWVEAVDGQYAKTGQAITPQGEPGGEWIVAARVNPDGTVPCVAPSGRDTFGRVSEGTELANICVLEDIGAEYNALNADWGWTPLWNFATLEVCSLNNPFTYPHPDDAQPTRTISSCLGLIGCYTGHGAALNDLNGAERDWLGQYYVGDGYCHYIRSGGLEVPGAKRPATRSFPVPSVKINSYIQWRPVNPNVNIANER